MPTPVHLLALLIGLAVMAFRTRARLHRWRYVLLAAVAWSWLLLTPAFAHHLALRLEARYPPVPVGAMKLHEPVIVVLASGSSYDHSLPDALQLDAASFRRTLTAVDAWRTTGGTLLFSGTVRPPGAPAVAARMAMLARMSGVPAAHVRVEPASLDTSENLRNSFAMIDADRDIVIVTSAIHMPRAMAVAHALGRQPHAIAADHRGDPSLTWRAWLPNSKSLPLLRLVVHELTGLAYYRLRGWTHDQ